MALKNYSKLRDNAISWLQEKFDFLRDQLIIGRSRMTKDPYKIITEGTREDTMQIGHMYFFNNDPK